MENRTPVISRTYEKGPHRQAVFVYLLTGVQITGEFFRFAVMLDNVEEEHKRLESGDRYEIRKKFFNYLKDLEEDGWKRVGSGAPDPSRGPFFDPERM